MVNIRVDTRYMPPRGFALLSALITLAIFCSPASAAPKKVAFKFSSTTYSVAENAGAAALIANRTAIGTWEQFDLVTS